MIVKTKSRRPTPDVPPEPNTLDLVASAVQFDAAAPDGEPQTLRRFTMTAYTGGAMQLAGWRYPVVVDLAGIDLGRQRRPILLDHTRDVDFVMGQTDSLAVMNDQLIVAGQVMGTSPKAQQVIGLHDRGFAWQASIGARAEQVEFVPEGKTSQANGREFAGPVNIARRATLGEISFVVLGADDNTSAQIAATSSINAEPKQEQHEMEFQAWLAEQGFEQDALSEKQLTNLRALHAAGQERGGTEAATAVADLRAQLAAETQRVAAVRTICAGKHDQIESQAIADGWDAARTELEVLRAERPKAPAIHSRKEQLDNSVLLATACLAGGVSGDRLLADCGEPAVEAAQRYRGIGIQDFFRLIARAEGRELPLCTGKGTEFIEAAFSTLSLPGILSNVANKMLLEGYQFVEDTWRRVAKVASVGNFKEHTRYRLTNDLKYEKVGKDGELKHGELGEQAFKQKIDTYGKMFGLSRQDIIDDDLEAFAELPKAFGMGAAEALAEVFWTLVLANPDNFFSTANKNYLAGADTELSYDGLRVAYQMFLEQTKPNGRPLGLEPSILLVPPALRVTADQLMTSVKLNETTAQNKPKPVDNTFAGKFSVEHSAYLSNMAVHAGASSKAWYLLADPNRLAAFEVAFLNGIDRPTIEQSDVEFNKLGIQFRGYHDFGVREQDPRGALKLKGEA